LRDQISMFGKRQGWPKMVQEQALAEYDKMLPIRPSLRGDESKIRQQGMILPGQLPPPAATSDTANRKEEDVAIQKVVQKVAEVAKKAEMLSEEDKPETLYTFAGITATGLTPKEKKILQQMGTGIIDALKAIPGLTMKGIDAANKALGIGPYLRVD